jgi:hypothetical protein
MHGHLAIPLRPPHLHNSSSSPTHHDRRHLPSLRTCSQTDALLILLPRGPARSGPTTTSPPGRVRLASSLYDISALEPLENTERLARIVWCRVRVEGHWREEVEEDEGGGGGLGARAAGRTACTRRAGQWITARSGSGCIRSRRSTKRRVGGSSR